MRAVPYEIVHGDAVSTPMDDTLAGLIDGPRAQGAFLLESVLNPPWGLRIEDGAALSLVTMVRGEAWIRRGTAAPVPVSGNNVAVVSGTEPYTLRFLPATR